VPGITLETAWEGRIMKTGKTLVELAVEIERQTKTKADYIAPTKKLEMTPWVGGEGKVGDVALIIPLGSNTQVLAVNDLAHRQIGDRIGIPAKYYDRMRQDAPSLLADNVNHWLHAEPENRLIRTLDGRVRAFLSDKFRPLENVDLAKVVLPVLRDLNVDLLSCEVTERRLYIKVCDKTINRSLPVGKRLGEGHHRFSDVLCPALVLSNSEVGDGALTVDTAVWTEGCTNLAVLKARSMRKYHLGGRHAVSEDLAALLSDQTKRLSDAAVWAQVRDVVKGAFDRARFDAEVDKIGGLTTQAIESDDIVKVVDLASRRLGISDGEKGGVLKHLIQGGDLSRYGLFNAITRTAEDLADYDRATEFERIGGEVIELPANDWAAIANAA
jgi:hypothetical protein